MSIENEIQDLTQSTTDLLNAVNTKKVTLDNAVATAEAAVSVATTKATEAASVVSSASTSATEASASAANAATSAASASQLVTGVDSGLPEVRPSLNLDFVNSKRVDPRIDFTRSTTATYYDGKTTVKAEENLFTYSEQFENAAWVRAFSASVTANTTLAPDGATTADTVSCPSQYSGVSQSKYLVSGKTYTLSVWAKAATGTNTYHFVAGSLMQTYTPTSTWERYSFTFTASATQSVNVYPVMDRNTSGFGSVYIWGAQFEERDSLTAYTPTTTSPITNYIPVLQTAAINKPRLDHDPVTGECKGLLMEEARTNHVRYSEDISYNAFGYDLLVTVATNLAIAPNGTLTADKVIPTGNGARRGDHFTFIGSMVEGDTYTLSGFYKADGSHYTRVGLGGVFGNENATFDFDIGEFVSQAANVTNTKAENVGNGWWRLSVTYVFQNQIGNNYPYALIAQPKLSDNSTSAPSYTGYNGVYVWGVQYEKAFFATSYIPTDGTAVTRSGDIASISAETLNYHPTEGTIVFDGESGYPHGIPVSRYAFVVNGINPNDLFLYRHDGGGAYRLGGGGISMYFNDEDISAHHRHVVSYNGNNDLVYYTETGLVSSDTSVILPTNVTEINLGQTASNAAQYSGWIKGFSYYPQRITNTEAEALAATV